MKARAAEDAWNSRDPERVSLAYTLDTRWRNRNEFLVSRGSIIGFARRCGRLRAAESRYALFTNTVTIRIIGFGPTATKTGSSMPEGLMSERHASINELPIAELERLFRWPQGARPADHKGLSEMGL